MRKVLIISPYFPPIGGSGVFRLHRWVKYLPEFGIQPIVVHYDRLPGEPLDESLLKELREEVIRYPVRYIEPSGRGIRALMKKDQAGPGRGAPGGETGGGSGPGVINRLIAGIRDRVLIPDLSAGWIPFVAPALKKIFKAHTPEAIITTSSPGTPHLLGLWLKRKYQIPWIADFRDPWTDSPWAAKLAWPFSAMEKRLEKQVVREADFITTYSDGLGEMLWRKLGDQKPEKFVSLGPAVDTDKFDQIPVSERQYDFLYTGALEYFHPREIFFALQELNREKRAKGEELLRLGIAGKISLKMEQFLGQFEKEGWLELLGYLPHQETISLIKSCRILILLHSKQAWWVTGKMAEYLYSGKPILAVLGEGEMKSILKKFGRIVFALNDQEKISSAIRDTLALKAEPRALPKELTARGQSGIIAALLEKALDPGRGGERISGGKIL